ncbi:hypothetical protein DFP72DRAFT_882340 [Ephemerocybe angulata]|uniref:Uncharacterized protein n=1 Tax=Ephemerocybe angulata TaxID=980116 RepID=A0A8H6I8F9_9AGAR|nr:hypothetical protein DFP72DRAFT_882340 [Tulosesus angulatus]
MSSRASPGRPLLLPQEIVDLIIDFSQDDTNGPLPFVHKCDIMAMASLSLVSKACLSYSEDQSRQAERCKTLKSLLDAAPFLRRCIERLIIPVASIVLSPEACASATTILPLLTHVTNVTIHGEAGFTCKAIPPSLHIALYDLMARPTVDYLHLVELEDFDVVPLAQWHHVKGLHMHDVYPPGYSPKDCSDDTEPPANADAAGQLLPPCFPLNNRATLSSPEPAHGSPAAADMRTLSIKRSGAALQILLSCIQNSEEATLALTRPCDLYIDATKGGFDPATEKAWDTFLHLGGTMDAVKNLQLSQAFYKDADLELLEEDENRLPRNALPLSQFPRLKNLVLKTVYEYVEASEHPHTSGQDPLPLLVSALDRLARVPQAPLLELLDLSIDFLPLDWSEDESCTWDYDTEESMVELSKRVVWAQLDEILAKESVFSKLGRVKIAFQNVYGAPREECEKIVLKQMPRLAEKGVLEVTMF